MLTVSGTALAMVSGATHPQTAHDLDNPFFKTRHTAHMRKKVVGHEFGIMIRFFVEDMFQRVLYSEPRILHSTVQSGDIHLHASLSKG